MQTTRLMPVGKSPKMGSPSDGLSNQASPSLVRFSSSAFKLDPTLARKLEGHGDASSPQELSEAEKQQVEKLQERDKEVRAHEQEHLASAGSYAKGGPQYDFQVGPDKKAYAIGGHVDIDVSPVPGDPQATVEKAQTIQRAALAPGDASAQDQAVAAQAASMAMEAQQQRSQGSGEAENRKGNPNPMNPMSREQSLLHPCGSGPCTCRSQVPWVKDRG